MTTVLVGSGRGDGRGRGSRGARFRVVYFAGGGARNRGTPPSGAGARAERRARRAPVMVTVTVFDWPCGPDCGAWAIRNGGLRGRCSSCAILADGRLGRRDDDADEVVEGRRAAHSTGGRRAGGSTSDCGRSPPFASAPRRTRGYDAPSACAVRGGRGGLTRRRSPRVAPESAREAHRRYAPNWPIPVRSRTRAGLRPREKTKTNSKNCPLPRCCPRSRSRPTPRHTPPRATPRATPRAIPHPAPHRGTSFLPPAAGPR